MAAQNFLNPLTINGVKFKNRILRSSIGGRTCNYDGTVTDVWKNFEKRFAEGGVGGIISTTFHVNSERLSPLQYPSIADGKFVPYLKKFIPAIQSAGGGCRYIVQIGDPGYTTYTSLFAEARDAISSSNGFDAAFGYNNTRRMLTTEEIETSIQQYVDAARRVQETGADGIEITATKGYLIHQFLNPGINRRSDEWGGDADRRFLFLKKIIEAIRAKLGRDYLLGVRLSGADYNWSPPLLALLRTPWPPLSIETYFGNEQAQMIDYANRLQELGVDYLHVVAGYGFPNPHDVPGEFPFDEIRMFFDSVRHLSCKAAVRARLMHFPASLLTRPLLSLGWDQRPEVNLPFASAFKHGTNLPVIANGGFQSHAGIEHALQSGSCDMVSMARALIANPCLVKVWYEGRLQEPSDKLELKPCSRCNKCVGRTTTSPLGCYDQGRFESQKKMMDQILEWNCADSLADPDTACGSRPAWT